MFLIWGGCFIMVSILLWIDFRRDDKDKILFYPLVFVSGLLLVLALICCLEETVPRNQEGKIIAVPNEVVEK